MSEPCRLHSNCSPYFSTGCFCSMSFKAEQCMFFVEIAFPFLPSQESHFSLSIVCRKGPSSLPMAILLSSIFWKNNSTMTAHTLYAPLSGQKTCILRNSLLKSVLSRSACTHIASNAKPPSKAPS